MYLLDRQSQPVFDTSTIFFPGTTVHSTDRASIMQYPVSGPHPLATGKDRNRYNWFTEQNIGIQMCVDIIDPRTLSDNMILRYTSKFETPQRAATAYGRLARIYYERRRLSGLISGVDFQIENTLPEGWT